MSCHGWDFKGGMLSQIHTPQERAGVQGATASAVVAEVREATASAVVDQAPLSLISSLPPLSTSRSPCCLLFLGAPLRASWGKWDLKGHG